MVIINSYEYYVVISIAFIQLALLTSLMYQIFKGSSKSAEKEQGEVKIISATSTVNQLEFDTPPKKTTNNVNPSEIVRDINEDELKVLAYLLSKGGEAYQAEIARELGFPKSTMSRIIRRLYERGLVTVRRVSRFSYVQIVDIDLVSDIVNRSRPD